MNISTQLKVKFSIVIELYGISNLSDSNKANGRLQTFESSDEVSGPVAF